MKTAPSETLEEFRVTDGPFGSTPDLGMNGVFIIPLETLTPQRYTTAKAQCIVSDGRVPEDDPGYGWEHVSALIRQGSQTFTPEWDVMSALKDAFWREDETVMQLHPRKKDHINFQDNTLHLWRPIPDLLGGTIPTPPKATVGPYRKMTD